MMMTLETNTVLTMAAGPELDAIVAERVMGIDLRVPRERALAAIGYDFIRVTGRVFTVDFGAGDESVPMPSGETLGGHASDKNFNDRYARYLAERGIEKGGDVGAAIARRVEEYRAPVKSYSTDIAAAFEVVDAMHRRIADADGKDGFVPAWPRANYLQLACLGSYGLEFQGGWAATFCCIESEEWFENGQIAITGGALGENAPEAIARAALKALDVEAPR